MQTYSEALVKENMERIEGEIDRGGLQMLLEVVEMVCDEKAEHIRTNWQDERLAKQWSQAAREIRKAMQSKSVSAL